MAAPVSALDSATDLTAFVVYDRVRGTRQARTGVIVGIAMGAFAGLFFVLAVLGARGLVWLGVFFGVIALMWVGITALLRAQIGSRVSGFSPRGVFVIRLPAPIAWDQISQLSAVRYPNRKRGRDAGALLATAMSRGGVNDGGRVLNVILRDAAAVKEQLGKDFGFLVTENLVWEQKGAHGFAVDFAITTDDAGFTGYLAALKVAADAHGIPITLADR